MLTIERRVCAASDGVPIVYAIAGSGEPALVFIHGGLADRTFWEYQLTAFAPRHRVLALDLPGHGESGSRPRGWGIPEFGTDVRSVVEAERLTTVILVGNSLGGPVAIEAALLLHGTARGVIGVDTFQDLTHMMSPQDARRRAVAFRDDFAGTLKQMVQGLFHPDADPRLVADVERRMARTSPGAVYEMFLAMGGYDLTASARRLLSPLRAINGDLYRTDVEAVQAVKPDFDAVVMAHTGHYPMLERPVEFDRLLANVVTALTRPV